MTFARSLLTVVLLTAVTAFSQTASMPASVPTDADLLVAFDRAETKLTVGINPTTLSIPVESGSFFPLIAGQATLITIENEQIKVCGRSGNTLTVCSGGRGFANTQAGSHVSGTAVAGRVSGWYHNRATKEIQATAATAMNATTAANTAQAAASSAAADAAAALAIVGMPPKTFAPQSPFGSLVGGITNVVILSPCPAGVNGTDKGHYLYISGGFGTSEAVAITGGSCTSGAASGTVTLVPASSHAGAWTISSATAGIREAISLSSSVRLPPGTMNVYGPIVIPGSNVQIVGSGTGASVINASGFTTQDVIRFQEPGGAVLSFNRLQNLSIQCAGTETAGYAVSATKQNYFLLDHVVIGGCASGVYGNELNLSQIRDIQVVNAKQATGIGVHLTGNDSFLYLDSVNVISNKAASPLAGFRIQGSGNTLIKQCESIGNLNGMLIDPGTGQAVASVDSVGFYADNSTGTGIAITPVSGGSVMRLRFVSPWVSSATGTGMYISSASGGTTTGVTVDSGQFYLNGNYGLLSEGAGVSDVRVTNSVFAQNGIASSGSYAGALFNHSHWMFTGNRSGATDGLLNTQSYGIAVFSGPHTDYVVSGNNLSGNTAAAISDGGTGDNRVIQGNLGIDDSVPTIPAASTIALNSSPSYIISGSAGLQTMNGGWSNRSITLVFNNAAPGTILGGGNFATTFTPIQNTPIRCTYLGGYWYCK